MHDIKEYIEKYAALLPVGTSISFTEAEKRAGSFLEAMSRIIEWKHLLTEGKIKYLSIQTVTYAEQLSKGTAKTVTENKTVAEASSEYTKAREDYEQTENDISYLKAYLDLFQNAHIFYRTMAKGDNV